jgi:hypothetical protein
MSWVIRGRIPWFNEVKQSLPRVSLGSNPLVFQPGGRRSDSTCNRVGQGPLRLLPFRELVPAANSHRWGTPERRLASDLVNLKKLRFKPVS